MSTNLAKTQMETQTCLHPKHPRIKSVIRERSLDYFLLFQTHSRPSQAIPTGVLVFQHLLVICMHSQYKAEGLEPIHNEK